MMEVLAVIVLLLATTHAQYSSRISSTTDVPLSVLSKLSPRAGPARRDPPALAVQGLGTGPTTRALGAFGPFTHAQLVGSNPAGVGSGAYALTLNSGRVPQRTQLQGNRDDGGYAVTEAPQEGPIGRSPQAYQLVPQRVAVQSPTKQPETVHQFQYPVQRQFQNPQLQQPLFVPYGPEQPQQYLRETSVPPSSVTSNAPVNFPQSQGQPQPSYTLQQQFYEQEPKFQYVQSNPSIPLSTPSPIPQVSLPSENLQNYPLSASPVGGGSGAPGIPNQVAEDKNGYAVDTSAYTGSQQYYAIPANDINSLKTQQEQVHYTSQSPIRGFYHRQFHPQSATARPLIQAARDIPIPYQQEISQARDKNILSQGIYNSYNQPNGNVGNPQQLKVFTYSPQQSHPGSYSSDSTYDVQNSVVRNPVDYASPFARQELLQSRQRETIEQIGQLNPQVRKLSEDGDYGFISRSDDSKNINSFGSGYPINLYG